MAVNSLRVEFAPPAEVLPFPMGYIVHKGKQKSQILPSSEKMAKKKKNNPKIQLYRLILFNIYIA